MITSNTSTDQLVKLLKEFTQDVNQIVSQLRERDVKVLLGVDITSSTSEDMLEIISIREIKDLLNG